MYLVVIRKMRETFMTISTFGEEVQSRLIYAGKVSETPNWNFPSHKHDDLHEIVVVCGGEGTFTIGGVTYEAAEGDILIYNKGVLHEEYSSADKPIQTYYCGFSFGALPQGANDWVIPPDREPFLRSSHAFAEISSLMKMLFHESSLKEEGHETVSRHLLDSIIILIRRAIQSEESMRQQETSNLAVGIKDFIDQNFAQNISLKDLGKHFHVNPYYVSHAFKEKYNLSPIHYAIHRRIGEAGRLLISTEMKVWEIAKILGYENPNYFSIIFKRVTGQSPNQFRESKLEQQYRQ